MQLPVIASSFLLTLGLVQLTGALRFTSIGMPALVQRATNFWLACQFELEPGGQEQLYSVKWYKNNEEFYRLIATPAATSASGLEAQEASGKHFQRQYFAQTGVNVLMSASNATHVRLLNASLESEGAYACEISSENLSTIRHEREIKVYVLPHARLSVIGLRNVYALGERVELLCASDFSRPAGTLAWFINNQRITQGRDFELRWRRETSGGNGELAGALERVSLALKFKLTDGLLSNWSSRPDSGGGNQSLRMSQGGGGGGQRPLTAGELLMLVECRAKLVDVSDVTFSELKVARPAAGGARRWTRAAAAITSGRNLPPPPVVAKSQSGQRVIQEAPLAGNVALGQLLAHPNGRAACRRGPLAMQLEDPIILEAASGDEDNQSESSLLELAEGSTLNLNCSTAGALLLPGVGEQTNEERPTAAGDRWPLAPMRRKFPQATPANGQHDELDNGNQQRAEVCTDLEARREALISGKDHAAAAAAAVASGNAELELLGGGVQAARVGAQSSKPKLRNQQQQQLLVAYVKLTAAAAADSAHDGQAAAAVTKSLAQLGEPGGWPTSRRRLNAGEQPKRRILQQLELRAPPLLEWFINNQEAPKSSASYSPELPLKSADQQQGGGASDGRRPPQLDSNSLEGAPGGELTSGERALLPSVDYAEYFANWDATRPADQHLSLSLKLDKRHFKTPDSQVTLRCASTQAQVLMLDSASVALQVAPPSVLDDVRPQQPTDARSRNWQQRPSAGNQIKPKYLHQHPRASNQRFGGHSATAAAAAASHDEAPLGSGNGALRRNNPSRCLVMVALICTQVVLALVARLR